METEWKAKTGKVSLLTRSGATVRLAYNISRSVKKLDAWPDMKESETVRDSLVDTYDDLRAGCTDINLFSFLNLEYHRSLNLACMWSSLFQYSFGTKFIELF